MKLYAKILITGLLLLMVALKTLYPTKVDNTSLAILFIILIVWSFNWIRKNITKVKFGDITIEIESQEIKETVSRVQISENDIKGQKGKYSFDFMDDDSNLLLVKFRIEIEKKLRELYEINNIKIDGGISLSKVLSFLERNQILDNNNFEALRKIIEYGNSAVHGANVEDSIKVWAKVEFSRVIEELEWLIAKSDVSNLQELNQEFELVLKRMKESDHKYIYHILLLAIKDANVNIGPHNNLQKYELAQQLSEFGLLRNNTLSSGKEHSYSKYKITPLGRVLFRNVKEVHDKYDVCEFCFPSKSKGEKFFT